MKNKQIEAQGNHEPDAENQAKAITKAKTSKRKAKAATKTKGADSIMETSKVAKNVLDMQKTAFQDTYDVFTAVQDQAERAANMALASAFWIPEEGVRAIRELGQAFKQGRDEWKRCMDENFQAAEKLFVTDV